MIVAKCLLAKSAASQGAAYAAQGAYAPQGAYVAQGQGLQVEETTKVLKYWCLHPVFYNYTISQ